MAYITVCRTIKHILPYILYVQKVIWNKTPEGQLCVLYGSEHAKDPGFVLGVLEFIVLQLALNRWCF